MDHLVILKKSWGLLSKIESGEKTIESRWYKNKIPPIGKVGKGDTLYFKNSGEPVVLRAKVTKVEEFTIKDNQSAIELLMSRIDKVLNSKDISDDVMNYILNKKYALFVSFSEVEHTEPFNINKSGYGMQSAWITCRNIHSIKTKS